VPKPTPPRALAWLKQHRPDEPNAPVLLWGDARIGNMIFAPGGTPLAALDWETATFGQAEEDLAWYVFLDRHHREGLEVPQLEGFPPAAETIARYEELRPALTREGFVARALRTLRLCLAAGTTRVRTHVNVYPTGDGSGLMPVEAALEARAQQPQTDPEDDQARRRRQIGVHPLRREQRRRGQNDCAEREDPERV